jgi:protein phosphatase
MSGKNNEDRYAVSAFRLEGEKSTPVVFAVVSDGIGGHRAGEVAAEIAVEVTSRMVAASDSNHPVETLRLAIIQASQEIQALSQSDPEMKGMGATCACVWVIEDRLYIAYVGDSRIYLIRGGTIQQLTIDHTWIQEAIQAGILTSEQAQNHPNAHVIRRYLGSPQTVEPDARLRLRPDESDEQSVANQGLQILPGDQILACSDGLTDLVNASEILATLQQQPDQGEALTTLVNLANKRGGHDNITLVVLRLPDLAVSAPAPTPTSTSTSAPTVVASAETVRTTVAASAETVRTTVAAVPRSKNLVMALTCLGVGLILLVLSGLVGGAYYMMRGNLLKTQTATPLVATPSEQPSLAPSSQTPAPSASDTPSGGGVPTVGASAPAATLTSVQPGAEATPTYTAWPNNTVSP